MLLKELRLADYQDVERYLDLVRNGSLYRHFSELVYLDLSKVLDENQAKDEFLRTMYSSNRFYGQVKARPKKVFKSHFPSVCQCFDLLKKQSKKTLPILLQRLESYLVLDVVCKRISEERPDLPIFTIHDSIVTLQGEEECVQEILSEELNEFIGFPPSLRVKLWEPPLAASGFAGLNNKTELKKINLSDHA